LARIRTIKPEFPQSETIGNLSRDARLLFVQLWTIADDAGRSRAASRMLASLLYPYDDDAPGLMPGWLDELEAKGCIRRYEVDGSHYLEVVNWLKHQKIDRPSESRLPSFDEASPNTREHSRGLDADLGPVPRTVDHGPRTVDSASAQAELIPPAGNLPSTTEVSPSRKTGKKLAREESSWPEGLELDGDLHRYAEEAGIPFQDIPRLWERFKNHHQAKGSRFKDWRAAWRTWVQNEIKYSRDRRANGGGRPERAAYDPIEVARRQIAQFTQPEEEGTLWPKAAS